MKYKINQINEVDFDIITEDGGVVSVYDNDENLVSLYYQNRITDDMDPDEIWIQLGEGKSYAKDWPATATKEEIIQDALNWLVLPAPDEWILDDSIWIQFDLTT